MIDTWNLTIKNWETEVKAVKGDLVINIGGVLFLVQRKNGYNNVVCFRVKETNVSIQKAFVQFGHYIMNKGIQYIRVEGNTKRYFFLSKLNVYFPKGFNCIRVDENENRNVFYIKLCD